jgi:hypothetical protein
MKRSALRLLKVKLLVHAKNNTLIYITASIHIYSRTHVNGVVIGSLLYMAYFTTKYGFILTVVYLCRKPRLHLNYQALGSWHAASRYKKVNVLCACYKK